MSASTERKNRLAAREAGTDKKLLARQEEEKKQAKSRRKWTIGTIAVVLLVLAIIFINSSLFYRVVPAVTVGDKTFSAAEANFYYGSYNMYAQYFGDEYAHTMAENDMVRSTALSRYASENGIALTEDEIAAVDAQLDTLKETASGYGFPSVNSYLSSAYGKGVTRGIVREIMLNSTLADKAYQTVQDEQVYTDEELEEAYLAFEGSNDLFDGAYFFIDASANETAADLAAAMTEAGAEADAMVMAYQDGEEEDQTMRFLAAVESQREGELPTELDGTTGSLLPEVVKDWFMGDRKAGDVASLRSESESENGYYVALFLNRDENEYNTVSVRHILIKAEAAEDGTYSEEALTAARTRAEEILAEWKAGEATEDSFAALANEYSEDAGSNTNGGLYENIGKGQMVQEFNDFCFAGHQPGDTAVVHGESSAYNGYHVIYFVGEGDSYRHVLAKDSLSTSFLEAWLAEQTEGLEAVHRFGYRLVA